MKKIFCVLFSMSILLSTFIYAPVSFAAQAKGDVNNDGLVTSSDYSAVRKHILGLDLIPIANIPAGDFNDDGILSSFDLVALRKILLFGSNSTDPDPQTPYVFKESSIQKEARLCADYLWDSTEIGKAGYGLTLDYIDENNSDRGLNTFDYASIASTGFALSALSIDVDCGWRTYDAAKERADKTLDNLLKIQADTNKWGFFYHFYDDTTGQVYKDEIEVSSIDTAILICGAISAGEYFGGTVKEKATTLYSNVNWKGFVNPNTNFFYLGWNSSQGFHGKWDWYSEAMMLYVLGAGTPNVSYRTGLKEYNAFNRQLYNYKNPQTSEDMSFIATYHNSAFTYQFSHAWIDFRNKKDNMGEGIDWYQNSVTAMNAQWLETQKLKKDEPSEHGTYSELAWGQSATYTRPGYAGDLGLPRNNGSRDLDFIAPYTAVASMPFTPEKSLASLKHYQSISKINSTYGLYESYSETKSKNGGWWNTARYYGINKGVTLLMLMNYENSSVWNNFMKNDNIKNGLVSIGIK